MTFSISRQNSFRRSRPSIRGLAFPLRVENGNLAVAEDFEVIRQSIESVVRTVVGERVMRQRFGLPNLLFTAGSSDRVAAHVENVRIALSSQVPKIDTVEVKGAISEEGILFLLIEYSVGQQLNPPTGQPLLLQSG